MIEKLKAIIKVILCRNFWFKLKPMIKNLLLFVPLCSSHNSILPEHLNFFSKDNHIVFEMHISPSHPVSLSPRDYILDEQWWAYRLKWDYRKRKFFLPDND